jgi:hypothetical protein
VEDNAWQPNVERTQADPDGFWMTRELPDGWRIHIRLVANAYKTVIDHLHVEPSQATLLRGIRGRIDLPHGDPREPTWARVTLPTARRQAAAALNTALAEDRQRHATRNDRREPVQRMPALLATFRGFTDQSTTPPKRRPRPTKEVELATIAAAYATATHGSQPTRPRDETLQRLRAEGFYYAPSTIGPLIARARAAGMLTATTPGKAGGRLTRKAERLLRQHGS